MGYGDFKLLAALGAWLGWQMLLLIILLSAFTGAVVGIALIVLRGRDRNMPIPFGPYLAAAGWIALMWGDDLVTSYLHVMRRALYIRRAGLHLRQPRCTLALLIALTGGIASGKSAVAEIFAKLGVPVLDTDQIARDVVEPGTPTLGQAGRGIRAGHSRRQRPSRSRSHARSCLRAIPNSANVSKPSRILRFAQSWRARAAAAGGAYQIHVIPLLVESGPRGLLRPRAGRRLPARKTQLHA